MNHHWFVPCAALLSLWSAFQHHSAFAAEKLPQAGDKASTPAASATPGSAKPEKDTAVFFDSKDLETEDLDDLALDTERSGTERITNTFTLQGGVGSRKGFGYDLNLGWHLDEDRLIEVKVSKYETSNTANFSTFTMQSLIVQNKIFMNNSLYVAVGAGYTMISAEGAETLTNSLGVEEDYSYKGKVGQTLLALSAGNEWQSAGWTWGIDWLRLYLPFSVSLSSSRIETTASNAELRRIKNDNDLKAQSWSVDFGVGVYGGYAF